MNDHHRNPDTFAAERDGSPVPVIDLAAIAIGDRVTDESGSWIGLVGGLVSSPDASASLLIVMAEPRRQTPVDVVVPLMAVRAARPGSVVLGTTRDALIGAREQTEQP